MSARRIILHFYGAALLIGGLALNFYLLACYLAGRDIFGDIIGTL